MLKTLSTFFMIALVVLAFGLVFWTSLEFKECVKGYGQNEPSAQHLEKGISSFVILIPTYRHCAGVYVSDNNAAITAVGTLVIALFTTVLGIFTISLAGSTRIAANAAEKAADAAIALELPVIRAEPIEFGFGNSSKGAGPVIDNASIGSLIFYNLGRTKAFPIEARYGWAVGRKLPKLPIYKFTKRFKINRIFEPDPDIAQGLPQLDAYIDFPAGERDQIRKGDASLWFFCCIAYSDFSRARHEAAFCWRWSEIAGLGIHREVEEAPAYNNHT